jgi:C4-dicarboxylate transporter/malic acid transport protein
MLDRSAFRPASTTAISQGHMQRFVRQFTPNWYAATMGTGILAIGLAQFPALPELKAVGEGLWLLNIGLFTLLTLALVLRWTRHFDEAAQIMRHPVMPMFFGCIPMGLATILNGFLIFGVPRFGAVAVSIAEFLWWVDAALSFACGLIIPFAMFTRQTHSLDKMTAVWLLPLVASEVAAVSGGLLLPHLADPVQQMSVLVISLVLWSCSVPAALSVLVVLLMRMVIHKLPEANMAASSWLPIGPIATGALALLVFSDVAPPVLAANGLAAAAPVFSGAALFGAILLWGYAFWWFAIATIITMRYIRNGIEFNLGWWGYTFPLGVFAVATLKLSNAVPFAPFAPFGATLVAVLSAIWIYVALHSLRHAFQMPVITMPRPVAEDFVI